jgi:hypothetical protein
VRAGKMTAVTRVGEKSQVTRTRLGQGRNVPDRGVRVASQLATETDSQLGETQRHVRPARCHVAQGLAGVVPLRACSAVSTCEVMSTAGLA